MQTKIYHHLKVLGFIEAEAQKISREFIRILKSLGVTCVKTIISIVKSLTVSLLHTWVLGFII